MSKFVIIVGKTGSGKTTLANHLAENFGYTKVVTCTTRKPREGEEDGVDYYFLSDEEFADAERSGRFLETSGYTINGETTRYGSVKESYLNREDTVVVLDPLGAMTVLKDDEIRKRHPLIVWLDIPDYIAVSRLIDRGDNLDLAAKRFAADGKNFDIFEKQVRKLKFNTLRIWSAYTVEQMARSVHTFAGMELL